MMKSLMRFHLAKEWAHLKSRDAFPVRHYPRHRQLAWPLAPSNSLQMNDDCDALEESNIISQLDQIEDHLSVEGSDKNLRERERRLWLKNKIIERKYFKKPSELNLLSWRAKEQICYLYGEYPDEWNVTKLAQSFPVSEEGIIKILKSKYNPTTQREIEKHDMRVRRHWLALRSYLRQEGREMSPEGGPSANTIKELVASEKLPLMINAGGFDHITVPQRKHQEKRKIGTFEAIVTNFVENEIGMQQDKHESSSHHYYKPLLSEILNLSKVNKVCESKPEVKRKDSRDVIKENKITTGAVSRRGRRLVQSLNNGTLGGIPLASSHMAELAMQGTGRIGSNVQSQKEDSKQHNVEYSCTDRSWTRQNRERMKVLQNIKLEKYKESQNDGEENDAYMYDLKSGYQYPLGKSDKNLEKLQVPKSLRSKGDLYQRGNYVYDEDGHFLFKIP